MPTLREYNSGMTGEFGEELYDQPTGEFGELLYDPVSPETTPWWELPGPEDKPTTGTGLPTFTNVRPSGDWDLKRSAAKGFTGEGKMAGYGETPATEWALGGTAKPSGGGRPSLAAMMAKREEERAKMRAAKKEAAQAKVEARKGEVKERATRMLEQEEREFEQEKLDKMYELYKQRTMKPVWRIP